MAISRVASNNTPVVLQFGGQKTLGLSTSAGGAVLLAGGAGAPEKLLPSSYLWGMRTEVGEGNYFSFRPFCSFSAFYHVRVLLSFDVLEGSHDPVTVMYMDQCGLRHSGSQ